jgi:hypothetical protein
MKKTQKNIGPSKNLQLNFDHHLNGQDFLVTVWGPKSFNLVPRAKINYKRNLNH